METGGRQKGCRVQKTRQPIVDDNNVSQDKSRVSLHCCRRGCFLEKNLISSWPYINPRLHISLSECLPQTIHIVSSLPVDWVQLTVVTNVLSVCHTHNKTRENIERIGETKGRESTDVLPAVGLMSYFEMFLKKQSKSSTLKLLHIVNRWQIFWVVNIRFYWNFLIAKKKQNRLLTNLSHIELFR